MKRSVLLTCVLAALALAACNGTITSVSFPPEAPWEIMETTVLSPTDDLVAVAGGAGLEALLVPIPAWVACGGPSPYLVECSDPACDPQVECGADPVIEKRYGFSLYMFLDRGVFTSGSVQLQDGLGATVVGLSIGLGAAGGGLDLAAGYSEGMIPGVDFSEVDAVGHLLLIPDWPDFGEGFIEGEVCSDGVCETGPIALCSDDVVGGDVFGYLTFAEPGTYSGLCGAVPVTLTVNPPFETVGECISGRKASACAGLTGQDRKTCNHAQIGICHAIFHVPSAHNN